MTTLTTIYSQPSMEALKELVDYVLSKYFPESETCDVGQLFYYNVFCAADTYANYDWVDLLMGAPEFEIPEVFTSPCSTYKERLDFVEKTINEVLRGAERPEWMQFIEMESSCDACCCEVQPSNFLRIEPINEEHRRLAELLVEFLYSPNRTTVVL